jgi:diguanylate cyclase (GGDEF)-like protein/PAS domain S-box-containing protein
MQKATILIVEDESLVALDIKEGLERRGYTVPAIVAYGEQVLKRALEVRPDLILMDIKLKGAVDGIEAARHVRDNMDVPIIFLTAFAEEETLMDAKVAEPFGYILKPFEERELVANVEMAISKHRMDKTLRERERYYRALIESASDIICITNGFGNILYVNSSIEKVLGYLPEEQIGKSMLEFIHPDDVLRAASNVQLARAQRIDFATDRYRVRHKDGSWRVIDVVVRNLLDDPVIGGFVVNSRDVTEMVSIQDALKESQERYMLAVEGANDGIWDWQIAEDRLYTSVRWAAMLGYREDEFGHSVQDWWNCVHPEDLERLRAELEAHLSGATSQLRIEHRMVQKDGTVIWVLTRGVAIRGREGSALRIAGSMTDITSQKQTEARLVYNAFHDALTGLPNRALFVDRLEHALERYRRHPEHLFAVLYMDLDRFKVVNDSLGHNAGDQLLVDFAGKLDEHVRAVDTVARLGGDEFVILLEDIEGVMDAQRIAERILEELQQPFLVEGQTIFTTASIGIVLGSSDYSQAEEVLRDADIAMYSAKALGKGRFDLFNADLRARASERLGIENDLRHALDRNELFLEYQPILSLDTGQLVGFEALLRWQHPQRGLIHPLEFIPVAEEISQIILIGQWVLEQACRQAKAWQDQFCTDPPLYISVNMSGKQFSHHDLYNQIKNVLSATGLDPTCLHLEVTENIFLSDSETIQTTFERLHRLGVKLEIDDFGTGYASFGYLQRIPISRIKIDRSFISRLDAATGNNDLISSILRLTQDLGVSAVAEGIETVVQKDKLRALGCAYGQGYYFSRPMGYKEAEAWLESGSVQGS